MRRAWQSDADGPRRGRSRKDERQAPLAEHGSYPDIDALFQEQATELDVKKREATLHKIQQLVHEHAIYAPLWQQAAINGIGPRVGESGLGPILGHAYSSPYEDVTLAGK